MKLLLRSAVLFALAGLLTGCASSFFDDTFPPAAAEMTGDNFAAHVAFLANPALGGRVAGTAGNRAAADYIADQFRQAGLKPAGDGGTFFQNFTSHRARIATADCSLTFKPVTTTQTSETTAQTVVGKLGQDFSPSAQGGLGMFSAPLVFAGYGLHNRDRNYNDYATVSVRGAVVMILAGEPHNSAGQSNWTLWSRQTRLSNLPDKLRLASEQGAVTALVVTPPDLMPEDDIDDVLGNSTAAIPAVRVSRLFANRILAAAGDKRTIEQLIEQIHRVGHPMPFALGGRAKGTVVLESARCRNVLGVLPADIAGGDKVIVIGAHYDHIPATGQLAVDTGPGVRPGANDNASGDAMVMLLAKALAATPRRHCTYVFAAFDAEEIGFEGSRFYVQHPVFPLNRVSEMVNIDEVGRTSSGLFLVLGNTKDRRVAAAIDRARKNSSLGIIALPITNKQHWSDQSSFAAAGVPTLFFHRLLGPRHTRQDTVERINAPGAAAGARFIYRVIRSLDESAGPTSAPSGPAAATYDLLPAPRSRANGRFGRACEANDIMVNYWASYRAE